MKNYLYTGLGTILYYGLIFYLIQIAHESSPGGPCVPSGGFVVGIFLVPISVLVISLVSFLKVLKNKPAFYIPLFTSVGIGLFILYMIFNH